MDFSSHILMQKGPCISVLSVETSSCLNVENLIKVEVAW